MSKTTRLLIAVLAVLAITLPTAGQYYVPQGNVLDANNRLNSGGINTARPGYQPNSSNRVVTGNVTSGNAFRGYSPIRDSNSFFLGSATTNANIGFLPSDRLTTYRRDSVGMNEVRQFSNLPAIGPLPYYSRSSTVANTGQILQGLNQPGTSQLVSPYLPIQSGGYGQGAGLTNVPRNRLIGTPGGIVTDSSLLGTTGTGLTGTPGTGLTGTGLTGTGPAGTKLPGNVNSRLLASPLFGGARASALSRMAARTGGEFGTSSTETPRPGASDLAGSATLADRRLAQTVLGRNDRSGAAMDRLLNQEGSTAAPRTQSNPLRGETSTGGQLSREIGATPQDEAAQRTGGLARPMRSPSAVAQASEAEERAAAMRRGQIDIPAEPLNTFVGTADERIKEHLSEAERLLREQRYYDAARRYEMAHAVDFRNPLPLFGRAMSLLAAGDYVSSSNDLFMAIQAVGPSGALKVDLQRFIPDLQTLDKRRAFIEQQLEVYDDFRLRFLLGWTEYMSGMPELGLTNMQKAAKAAPANMDSLRRFVSVLAEKQATQPAAAGPQQ